MTLQQAKALVADAKSADDPKEAIQKLAQALDGFLQEYTIQCGIFEKEIERLKQRDEDKR